MVPAALSVTVAGTFAAAPAARRLKLAVVIVAAAMGLLNVAVTVVLSGTLTAPFGGAWAVTVGATSLVKLQTEVVPSGVATVSATVLATVAVTFAAAPAARKVKVAVVIGAAFMGLLNVAETVVVSGTPVAPFGGAWAVTVGATSVVKLHTEAVPSGVAMVSVTVPATVAV